VVSWAKAVLQGTLSMIDFLNQELSIGDKVVLVEPGYRNFVTGFIHRMTACFVFIEYENGRRFNTSIKQRPEQLIRVVQSWT
jgi:hypothetical protein